MTEHYRIWNQDCVEGMVERLGRDSVGLCVTSPPFADLFSYSHKPEDVGNNPAGVDIRGSRFGLNFRFWASQLLEVLESGAVAALHIQQLIATIVQHGFMGRRDFRAAVIDIMVAAGFHWTGEVAIPKDPQIVAHRMQLHSLQFKTGKERDARALAPAANDYLMLFRKPGKSAEPVRCLRDPDANPGGWVNQEEWIRWARGVWDDIRETDILPRWRDARESELEKHVCPLQLEPIRRCVRLYSNPGSLVLDPFSGIGSTGWVAVEQGRRYAGFELKESYWAQSVENLGEAVRKLGVKNAPLPLFAGLEAAPLLTTVEVG